MTKRGKLLNRLLTKPKDFTWDELCAVLNGFGYQRISAGKTGGSRIRFVHANYPPIIMHKPHPRLGRVDNSFSRCKLNKLAQIDNHFR